MQANSTIRASGVWILTLALISITSTAYGQQSQSGGKPVATVAGQPVYLQELSARSARQLAQLRNQEYEITEHALESLIDQKLLQADATKQGISAEKLTQEEVDSKVSDPSDAEVKALYDQQRTQNRPFEEVKDQLKASLKWQRIEQARQGLYAQLWDQAHVVILLKPPMAHVSYDPARVRGAPHAPVVIVEFADFECPYCRAAEKTVASVLAKHPNEVVFAFRDFPLAQLHPRAQAAAEAAHCAGEQGQFWAYHDFLYASADNLAMPAMLKEAQSLHLDQKQFQSCVLSDKYSSQIQHDFQDGLNAGVTGTPAFFINGAFLDGNQPEAMFEQRIQDALVTGRAGTDAKRSAGH